MRRERIKRLILRCTLLASAALLGLIGAAQAKFPLATAESEPSPGITITGLGFARGGEATAVDRAVRDARQRAALVARASGVRISGPEEVELREITQFGEPESCGRGPERFPCPDLAAAAASVTFAIEGGSDGTGTAPGIAAHGGASRRVTPSDPRRNPAIRRAVLAARREATPRAVTDALRGASRLARAAGLQLGGLVSISEAPPLYYQPTFYDAALGSFGPGEFCGSVRRRVLRRDPETGAQRVVRFVRERRCLIPRPYVVRFEIRYEAR